MLTRDINNRPTINQILAMPVVTKRIRAFLNSKEICEEFSHTIIHKKNV